MLQRGEHKYLALRVYVLHSLDSALFIQSKLAGIDAHCGQKFTNCAEAVDMWVRMLRSALVSCGSEGLAAINRAEESVTWTIKFFTREDNYFSLVQRRQIHCKFFHVAISGKSRARRALEVFSKSL